MFPGVTAILVVHRGGEHLRRTLDAIAAQTRPPESLVAVLLAPDEATRAAVVAVGPRGIVELPQPVPFGRAVEAGARLLPDDLDDRAALWLLTEDAAPEPAALAALAAALETAPSLGIVGPKLVEWERADRLVSFGRTTTRLGRAVELVEPILDQGQEDERSDVLAVAPVGLLVRHGTWKRLGGFDPALPHVDDGLDLGIRTRLAGQRVAVAPAARVAFAADGLADAPRPDTGRIRRRTARRRRHAQLHRRLVAAPVWALPLQWLAMLPLAVIRSLGLLLAKRPSAIPGEFAAAVRAMVGLPSVARARAAIRRARTEPWSALAPLRLPGVESSRRRRARRELHRERARGRRHELRFLATGGGWMLAAAVLVSLVLGWRLLGFGGIAGGALLPLSDSLGELWRNAAYGWRDLAVGFAAPADPFAGLLAILGTIAFWFPPAGMTLLWLLAIPAAAMGAWMLAARLSEHAAVRAVAAVVWALAPMFLTALADGRPGALLTHVLLPWLGFAAFGAARSWSAAGAASLLFAGVVAASPSLAPLLAIAWLLALAGAGRGAARIAWMPVPALALALPVVLAGIRGGAPLGALADPGLPSPPAAVGVWQLAAGFPGGDWGGWPGVFAASPFDGIDPRVVAIVLIAPLALLAFGSLASPGFRDGLFALAFAGGGFATAVAATRLSVTGIGAESVEIWSGAGLSAGLLGLLVAAVCALRAMRRLRGTAAMLVAATGVVVSLPLTVGIATGGAEVGPAPERTSPAFVTAEAEQDPTVTTLHLDPEQGGGLRAVLVHGAGATLDDQSTLWYTGALDAETAGATELLAEAAGDLASRSGFDPQTAVDEFGVRYLLLAAPAGADGAASREALAVHERARLALDSNPGVVPIGDTEFGRLWRISGSSPDEPSAAPGRVDAGSGLVTGLQLAALGIALLLSIPIGAVDGEVRRRRAAGPPRKPRSSRPGGGLDGTDPEPASDAGAAAEPETAVEEPEAEPDAADADVEAEPEASDEPALEPGASDEPEPEASDEPDPEPDGRTTTEDEHA